MLSGDVGDHHTPLLVGLISKPLHTTTSGKSMTVLGKAKGVNKTGAQTRVASKPCAL
jgi:hypothetical protein